MVSLGWWRSRRLVYPKLLMAVLTGFLGVVVLLNPRLSGPSSIFPGLMGLLSGLLSAIAYTQVNLLGEAGEPEQRIVFYVSVGTALLGLLGAFLLEDGLTWPRDRTFWLLPAVGLFASLGQWCLTRAYTQGAALVVASLQYLGVVFSSLFGIFLFQDRLAWSGWLGMAIIVAAGLAATAWRPKRIIQPSPEAPCITTP